MIARLKTSKKWTALPKDFSEQIEKVFQDSFVKESKKGSFKAEGRIFQKEIMLRIGYLEKNRLKQINLEISVDIPAAADTIKKIHLCVDALGAIFGDYFDALHEGEEDPLEKLDIPLLWKEAHFQGETIFLQYTSVNSTLEAEADRILGIQAEQLVQDEGPDAEDNTEGEDISEDLESDEEETDTDPSPRMFGKIPKKNVVH